MTIKPSRNTYFKPEHATEVTGRARGLTGGGSPRWKKCIVSVLNETLNNTRKYLKDTTRAHNVLSWCVFMPQNEGCMRGWYPCLFLDQAVTIFRALGEKRHSQNAPQRNCRDHRDMRVHIYSPYVKDRDARVWTHGTLLKRLIVISALIQMDSFLLFFSDLTKCYAPMNCIKTIHITNNRYNKLVMQLYIYGKVFSVSSFIQSCVSCIDVTFMVSSFRRCLDERHYLWIRCLFYRLRR